MPKPTNFPEEILDYAQCYLYSGLMLAHQFEVKPPYKTIQNHSNGYLLCSHFLMAHGLELYLKFFIKLFGKIPPADTHNLSILIVRVNNLLRQEYRKNIFNISEMKLIAYLDRYEKFRYPTDKNWNVIPGIFDEAKKWTDSKSKKFNRKFEGIIEKLNSWGYMITRKINKNKQLHRLTRNILFTS